MIDVHISVVHLVVIWLVASFVSGFIQAALRDFWQSHRRRNEKEPLRCKAPLMIIEFPQEISVEDAQAFRDHWMEHHLHVGTEVPESPK